MLENAIKGTIRHRRKLNRVGKPATGEIAQLATIGQRMTTRRLELRLTQAEIARQVRFIPKSGRRRGVEATLSRNAYCMYEIDGSEPDLLKIEGIARALKVEASWLAFGGPRLGAGTASQESAEFVEGPKTGHVTFTVHFSLDPLRQTPDLRT